MLEAGIMDQLRAYMERLVAPIELVASLDDGDASAELRALVEDVASTSPLITARYDGAAARRPSFTVGRVGEPARIGFAGLPMGHEFTSLVLALLQASGYPPKVSDEVIAQAKGLAGSFDFVLRQQGSNYFDDPGSLAVGVDFQVFGRQDS